MQSGKKIILFKGFLNQSKSLFVKNFNPKANSKGDRHYVSYVFSIVSAFSQEISTYDRTCHQKS